MLKALVQFSLRFRGVVVALAFLLLGYGLYVTYHAKLDVFPDFATEAVEVRDLGDVTLARLRVHGHGADSDAPLDAPLWLSARWRQGKCVRWGAYGTEDDALEAAGLRE